MKHLNILKWIHLTMGIFSILGVLVVGGIAAWLATLPDLSAWVVPVTICAGIASLIIGILFIVSGTKVGRGEGRILATALGVLQIGNCPGIFVAVYTVWVCWINEETKAVFEGGGGATTTASPAEPEPLSPLGGPTS